MMQRTPIEQKRIDFCTDNVCQNCVGTGFVIDHARTGRALAFRRKEAGLTMVKVAKGIGISVQFLNSLEKGRRFWTSEYIEKYVTICDAAKANT